MNLNFTFSPDQKFRISQWMKEQELAIASKQGREVPYYGASGGAYSYEFTPTTLGLVIRIKNNLSGAVFDVTDYENW